MGLPPVSAKHRHRGGSGSSFGAVTHVVARGGRTVLSLPAFGHALPYPTKASSGFNLSHCPRSCCQDLSFSLPSHGICIRAAPMPGGRVTARSSLCPPREGQRLPSMARKSSRLALLHFHYADAGHCLP